MLEIKVPLQFDASYDADNLIVHIPAGLCAFDFELRDGSHIAKAKPMPIGQLPGIEGRRLMATLTFAYDLDLAAGIITVCRSDFNSARTLYLSTFPEGMDEVCHERASGGGYAHDDHLGNRHWVYPTALTPGLDGFLRRALREACAAMIAALQSIPDLIVRLRTPPPELPLETYLDLLMVYSGEDFVGYFDPAETYGTQHRYVGVDSIYAGTAMWGVNAIFANVLGSTGDPKHGVASWVALWAQYCNGNAWPVNCTSNGFPVGFVCNAPLYGGHIINSPAAAPIPVGSNAVYLLPICNSHNNVHYVGPMSAIHYQNSIWLNHFQQ